MKTFKADLHVHTCLSPCGELEMSPKAIAEQASVKDIDILGICDHNSAENVLSLLKAAAPYQISVLPGIEVTSLEEVHVLAIFDKLEPALLLQEIIYENLPGENVEEVFGMQVAFNENGDIIRLNKKLLIGASTLSIEHVIQIIHSFNGLAIASHIDRESFSLLGQLGFIPDYLELDAVEISSQISIGEARKKLNPAYPITMSSDAHSIEDIGRGTTSFFMEKATIKEIKKAFLNEEGRVILF